MDSNPALHPAHPGPLRARISRFSLWFSLMAAPLAWSLDELGAYILAANNCQLKGAGAAALMVRASSPGYVVLTVVTWLIALAGVWVALQNWRKTHDEHIGGGGHLLERGEGRTRFMSMCGLMTSVGFAIGFVYMSLQTVAAPLCEP